MLKFCKMVIGSLMVVFLFGGILLAQSVQSSLTGLVTDRQGAVAQGAKVVATEVATNVQHEESTNENGLYSFPLLPPGTYVITVTLANFKEVKSNEIVILGDTMKRFDATLDVGSVNETVVVTGISPTLNTENAETGDLQVGKDVVKEPVQRNGYALLELSSGNYYNGTPSIGGQRGPYNNLTIDGVTTMNNDYGAQSGAMSFDQSFESIAEMKVINGNGSAEDPGFAGMVVTTKGGTNELHGSGFYDTDNSALNAHPLGSTPGSSFLKGPQIQWYGGSVGGPVLLPHIYNGHNKTFFYVTWEHRLFPAAAGNAHLLVDNVPTPAFRGETNPLGPDFSSLGYQLYNPFTGQPFANNVIPNNMVSPAALALQKFVPEANVAGTSSFVSNFQKLVTSPEGVNREDIRIDHNFSSRDSISGRYTYQNDQQSQNFENNPDFWHSTQALETNTYISETHSFSANVLNEFRVGYSRDNRVFTPNVNGIAALSQSTLVLAQTPANDRGFPNLSFQQSGIVGTGVLPSAINVAQEYSLLDNVSWQIGKHSFKGGVLLRNGRPTNSDGNFAQQFGNFNFNGFATAGPNPATNPGFDYADFLLGIPNAASQNTNIPNTYIRKTDTGLFGQDTWHITSKLTLNYGVRWEYYMPPTDADGRRVNFDPSTGNIVVASATTLKLLNPNLPTVLTANAELGSKSYPGDSLLFGRHDNFGPRFGFAYMLDKRTVVRGGYGIYFGQLINAVQDSFDNTGLFGTNLGFSINPITNHQPMNQFPAPFQGITSGGGSTCTIACGITISGSDPHLKTPTTQQWNVTVEHDFGHSLVARAAYRGFFTTQLPVVRNLVIPKTPGDPQLYPFYGEIDWTYSGGIQRMNALDLSLERKFTAGLTFRSAYTLAKDQSDVTYGESGSVSNPYNVTADMGNVNFIPRHRLVNNVVWDIPYGKGMRFGSGIPKAMDYVVGGWEFVVINVEQSGGWLTPSIDSNGSIVPNEGIALRPNCSGSTSVSNRSAAKWFNTAAFSTPTPGTYGNCGVGIIEGPGLYDFNFGLHKSFKLTETAVIKFEANMMNGLNHGNLGNPSTDLSDPTTFGQVTARNFQSGGYNTFQPSATSVNGERNIWMGIRVEF